MIDLTALSRYRPASAQQAELVVRFSELLAQPAPWSRHTRPAHLTAGGVVVTPNGDQVLLTLHKKANQWFQFGGHVDAEDASLYAAAQRETKEESGLELELLPDPIHLDVHQVPFCHPGHDVWHYDVRFLAVCPATAQPVVSAESTDVAWWPVDSEPVHNLGSLIPAALAVLARS